MRRYRVGESTVEILKSRENEIKNGISKSYGGKFFDCTLGDFPRLKKAKRMLDAHRTRVESYGDYYLIIEYFLESYEAEYDRETKTYKKGASKILQWSSMRIGLIDDNDRLIKYVDSVRKAKKAVKGGEAASYSVRTRFH